MVSLHGFSFAMIFRFQRAIPLSLYWESHNKETKAKPTLNYSFGLLIRNEYIDFAQNRAFNHVLTFPWCSFPKILVTLISVFTQTISKWLPSRHCLLTDVFFSRPMRTWAVLPPCASGKAKIYQGTRREGQWWHSANEEQEELITATKQPWTCI